MTGPDLSKRLRDLSNKANPGPYGVVSYGSGTTYLTLGNWIGHYASDTVPMMGGGRAEIVNSNIPSDWGPNSDRKGATAHFLAELANAYRSGQLVVADDPAVLAAFARIQSVPSTDTLIDMMSKELWEDADEAGIEAGCAETKKVKTHGESVTKLMTEPEAWMAEWEYLGKYYRRIYKSKPNNRFYSDVIKDWRVTPLYAHNLDKELHCPDCGRKKATSVQEVIEGDCPKYWAINDEAAYVDCEKYGANKCLKL